MPTKNLDMLKMPPEWELMVQLALLRPPQTLPRDIDYQAFERCVCKNALPALVCAGIKKLPNEAGNPAFSGLFSLLPLLKRHCIMQMHALAAIADDFASAGISMLSLKGPLLAIELYGSPEFRLSGDLDILVDESKLGAACARLEALGYREVITSWNKTPKRRALYARHDEEMHRVYVRGDVTVELHWRISYRFAKPFKQLWQHRREKKLLGQAVFIPGETDNLCYLITHAAGHGFKQLRWLLDIDMLLKKSTISLSALYLEMKARGVSALLLETLLLRCRLPAFDKRTLTIDKVPIPLDGAKPLLSLSPAGQCVIMRWSSEIDVDVKKGERLVSAVYPLLLRTDSAEGLTGRRYSRLLPTLGRRSCFIFSLFTPRKADFELIDLPDSLFFLYYVIRPFHFLWRKTPFYRAAHRE